MVRVPTVLAAAAMVACALTAHAQDIVLPTPPTGYSWVPCPEIKAAFLRPDGWHFKSSTQGETLGYFITKEDIDTDGQFTTGLTVNVIRDIPKKKGMTPLEFAQRFRDAARSSAQISKEWNREMGPFQAVGFVYERKDDGGAFTVHNLVIANNGTGTVYLVMFEGPSSEWAETWKIAEPMLERLLIDDMI